MKAHIKEEISRGVNLHTIRAEKFKTNLIKFYFRRPLIPQEVTFNGLLPKVLQRGTNKHATSKQLSKELEYLYGAFLDGNLLKKGDSHIIDFSLGFVDPIYVADNDLLQSSIDLLRDVIYHPYTIEGIFKEEYLHQEKVNLEKRIKGRVNDKNKYALERCIEEMCNAENFRLYEGGRLEDLREITPENLFKHYLKVLATSPIDIVVVGNLDREIVKKIILKKLSFEKREVVTIPREKIKVQPLEVKEIREEMDINQGKLTMGFRTNTSYDDPYYSALMVYVNLLGGGPHSKLFLKVREERSLCYYIFAKMEKFKSIMLVSCGIDVSKYDETVDVINRQLEEIKKGNITDEEIINTKKAMINSVKEMGDNPHALADFYYGQVISNQSISAEELINNIEKVKKEEVQHIAERIILDTIYFLEEQK